MKTKKEKRIETAIKQFARSEHKEDRYEDIMEKTARLLDICGQASQARKVAVRIGMLIVSGSPTVVAPCCPDYSHQNGIYTFQGISGGVSLLAQKHIAFLRKVIQIVPEARIILTLADLEAEDEEIRKCLHLSKEEFTQLLHSSLNAMRQDVKPLGWHSMMMTELFPQLESFEKECAVTVQAEKYRDRIKAEMYSRIRMYKRIRPTFTAEEMLQRTIRTAAQYLAFGGYCAENGFIICNHTTTNLSWYLQTDAAFLHNPISVY
ncbi:MAG: hypothetical protein ACOZBH_05685 [Patescibacteria group bacterium]